MIYFNGLESIIESAYLEDRLGNKVGECNVFVNPGNTKYLVGKLVIINSVTYSEERIAELIENGCKIVSRIKREQSKNIIFQPYILRVCPGIMFNGRNIKEKIEVDSILQDYCDYEDSVLYFPKLVPEFYDVTDLEQNMTGLGWALYQVGVSVREGDTVFKNLDIIKLGKLAY